MKSIGFILVLIVVNGFQGVIEAEEYEVDPESEGSQTTEWDP